MNNRLQQTSVSAGGVLGLNFYPCDQGVTICTNNTGNIFRETIASGGQAVAVQEYRYDALNRLTMAGERNTATGFTPTCVDQDADSAWCQQFQIDAVGNATVYHQNMTPASDWQVTTISGANNMIHDAGGTTTRAGTSTKTAATVLCIRPGKPASGLLRQWRESVHECDRVWSDAVPI